MKTILVRYIYYAAILLQKKSFIVIESNGYYRLSFMIYEYHISCLWVNFSKRRPSKKGGSKHRNGGNPLKIGIATVNMYATGVTSFDFLFSIIETRNGRFTCVCTVVTIHNLHTRKLTYYEWILNHPNGWVPQRIRVPGFETDERFATHRDRFTWNSDIISSV